MKSLERILKARLKRRHDLSGRSFDFSFSRHSFVAKYKSLRRRKRAPLKREICLCLDGSDLAGGFFDASVARPYTS